MLSKLFDTIISGYIFHIDLLHVGKWFESLPKRYPIDATASAEEN